MKQAKVFSDQQSTRRRSEEQNGGEKRKEAVATPLCASWQTPNAYRRRRSLPPAFFSRVEASVAGYSATELIPNLIQT
jgi:hypothetical protein